jgi:hypothetical protein
MILKKLLPPILIFVFETISNHFEIKNGYNLCIIYLYAISVTFLFFFWNFDGFKYVFKSKCHNCSIIVIRSLSCFVLKLEVNAFKPIGSSCIQRGPICME